jgi:hypothetical protein
VPVVALVKKLVGAVVVGYGVIFAAKATQQHWSETPSVLVHETRAEGESSDD